MILSLMEYSVIQKKREFFSLAAQTVDCFLLGYVIDQLLFDMAMYRGVENGCVQHFW